MIPASYATLYTEADIDEAVRDLAASLEDHENEADPAWRAALSESIAADTKWLAEMIDSVRGPQLPLTLPIGLAAPRAVRGVWR
jgi:hypothetical protein